MIHSKSLGAVVLALAMAVSLVGCGLWRPTTVPLRILREAPVCPARPDTLVVMLPGSYSLPEDFVGEGFVAAVRARGVVADLWLVDAHRGYYAERSILDRLEADVIAPARAAGYRRLWFVGISIGAFGALAYAQTHPGTVDGIVMIGPYLGERPTSAAIAAQGGLARWQPDPGAAEASDAGLWRWLQSATRSERPALLLGYGADDRFAYADRLLAAALPAGRVFVAPGGHEWAPWRATWAQALDAAPLPRDPACVAPQAPRR